MNPAQLQQMMLLRGTGLPAPPQPIPAPNLQPSQMMRPSSVPDTPLSSISNLVQGVNSFVQQYQAGEEQKKAQAAQKMDQMLRLESLGIRTNPKEFKKLADKTGLSQMVDFESQIPAYNRQVEAAQGQPAQPFSMQGPPLPPPMAAAGMQPPPVTGQIPARPGTGQMPPARMDDFAMQQILNRQFEQGERQRGMEMLQSMDAQTRMEIMQGVYKGDRKATALAHRLKLVELTGPEQFAQAYEASGMGDYDKGMAIAVRTAMGEDKTQALVIQHAEKMAPFFGNDLKKATQYVGRLLSGEPIPDELRPGFSFAQTTQIMGQVKDLLAAFPGLDMGTATAYAEAKTSGDQATAGALLEQISKLKSGARLDAEKKVTDTLLADKQLLAFDDEEKRKNAQLRIQQRNLQLRERELGNSERTADLNNQLALMRVMEDRSGKAWGRAWDVYQQAVKDGDDEAINAAGQNLENISASMPKLSIPTNKVDKNGKPVMYEFDPSLISVSSVDPWGPFGERKQYFKSGGSKGANVTGQEKKPGAKPAEKGGKVTFESILEQLKKDGIVLLGGQF